jgi:hypothetical protein
MTPIPQAAINPTPATTSKTPAPANTLGFIAIAGVLGIVGGVVVRKNVKKK